MGKEFCNFCSRFGYCQFEDVANQIADSVPKGAGREKAQAAHDSIAFARELTRERECPQINKVKPKYPGIELL